MMSMKLPTAAIANIVMLHLHDLNVMTWGATFRKAPLVNMGDGRL